MEEFVNQLFKYINFLDRFIKNDAPKEIEIPRSLASEI